MKFVLKPSGSNTFYPATLKGKKLTPYPENKNRFGSHYYHTS